MQINDEMVRAAMIAENAECNPGERGPTSHSMRAALEAALAAMWQPIETAPKDGTPINIFVPENRPERRVLTAYWSDAGWVICSGSIVLGKPTYWAPAPPPAGQEPPRGET
jgi:hypothetical protein